MFKTFWQTVSLALLVGGALTTTLQADVPIGGFRPLVVMGITDDGLTNPDIGEYTAWQSQTLTGTPYGSSGVPYYTVCLFDTGANVHLLGRDDRAGYGIPDIGWTFLLEGAGPDIVNADILRSVGYFVDGLHAIDPINGAVNAAGFVGAGNIRPMAARPPSADPRDMDIPTVIGMPFAAYYTTVIRTDAPVTVNYNGEEHTSPRVDFYVSRFDSNIPAFDHSLKVSYYQPTYTPPTFIPDDEIYQMVGMDPTPTVSFALFTEARFEFEGRTASGSGDFLFDTGAQVTVISEVVAGTLGIFTDPAHADYREPDFTEEVIGIGGSTGDTVPGYYLDKVVLPVNGGIGDFELANVPVLVLNVPNDAQALDGIIGMNLFMDRNIIITPGYTGADTWNNPFIGITGVIPEPGVTFLLLGGCLFVFQHGRRARRGMTPRDN